jgi:hypothetical protein
MKREKGPGDSFTGFLDGYKAYNVAAVKEELDVGLHDIELLLRKLVTQVGQEAPSADMLAVDLQLCVSRLSASLHDPIMRLRLFSETFESAGAKIKSMTERGAGIGGTADQIVLLLLKTAKTARDPDLTKIAVRIGKELL